MPELDEIWSRLLAEAKAGADRSGKTALSDFLRLRSNNDAIRVAGVSWLIDMSIEHAAELSRLNPALTIERIEPHQFKHGNGTMTGSQLVIRLGVRCITVEAGWTRMPGDGIMRGGALAIANFKHFGMTRLNASLKLVHNDPMPVWLDPHNDPIDSLWVRDHILCVTD